MTNERWTADKNVKFIKEYKRCECLWDPKHPLYKNRDAREAAYKVIMKNMKMENNKDVISKIRTLRNTYNNELLKAKKKNRRGVASDDLYVSKIPWLRHMDFLKNTDSKDKTEHVTPNITRDASVSESNRDELTVPCTPSTNKRKIKDSLLRAVDILEKVSSQHFTCTTGDDEFDLFGRNIAQQLRQLPLEAALEAEEMLLSVMRKQRIRFPKQMSSQSGTSSIAPECLEITNAVTIKPELHYEISDSKIVL